MVRVFVPTVRPHRSLPMRSLLRLTTLAVSLIIPVGAFPGCSSEEATRGKMDGGAMDKGKMDGGAMDKGKMDGGAMDKGKMDGGAIDKGKMDGGAMDRGKMDGAPK
jgi:uncharacterized protein involved in copper resistance